MRFVRLVFLALLSFAGYAAPALADDCSDTGDCKNAPRNIDGWTGVAGGGAGAVIAYTIYKATRDDDKQDDDDTDEGSGILGDPTSSDDGEAKDQDEDDGESPTIEAKGEDIFGVDKEGLPPPTRGPGGSAVS
ncbi:MAG TPA: hypothetical protein VGT02_11355 [Methylomirabilota bacterium]|jgi:hypothetical protein|nr:hypothetical protein [Methylomirabilota bacterium]